MVEDPARKEGCSDERESPIWKLENSLGYLQRLGQTEGLLQKADFRRQGVLEATSGRKEQTGM